MTDQTYFLIIGLLIFVDLLFTAARTSILNASQAYMISVHLETPQKVEKTLALLSKRIQIRAAFRVSTSLLRLSIAALLVPLFEEQTAQLLLYFMLFGLFIWLLEFIVENLILDHCDLWAIRFTPLTHFLLILCTPILYIPLTFARHDPEDDNPAKITEDELISLVEASEQAGEIEKDESEMVASVFRLGDRLVREIMVPRVDMLTLNVNTPLEEAADVVLESGYSRVPVYQEQTDNVIGMLYTKDMLKVWRQGNDIQSLRELLRSAYFIPETKKVDELLDEMQSRRIHIAVVIDEYGGVAGLVTMEDIVEEIFGEIEDEFDDEEEAPYQQLSEHEYLFNGNVLLEDVNELLGSRLEAEDADTMAGLIYSRMGHVPSMGEIVVEGNMQIIVEELDERRILKIRVKTPISSSLSAQAFEKDDAHDH